MTARFNLFNRLRLLTSRVSAVADSLCPPDRVRWRPTGFLVDIDNDSIPARPIR
jgi:hypothetical protein